MLSTVDYANDQVWLLSNIINDVWQTYKMDLIKYKYYNSNSEWELFAYMFDDLDVIDEVYKAYLPSNNDSSIENHVYYTEKYTTVVYRFGFQRNSAYFTMTLIIPILALTVLGPIGLILPGKSLTRN